MFITMLKNIKKRFVTHFQIMRQLICIINKRHIRVARFEVQNHFNGILFPKPLNKLQIPIIKSDCMILYQHAFTIQYNKKNNGFRGTKMSVKLRS